MRVYSSAPDFCLWRIRKGNARAPACLTAAHILVGLLETIVDRQADILAQFSRDIVHDALEAVEGRADLDHAQLQRAVAHLFHQGR